MSSDYDCHKWPRRWLNVAKEAGSWSKDSVQVGAVIVDNHRNIRSLGYNGIARGLDDQEPRKHMQPFKTWYYEHAERNALYACARIGVRCEGCDLYTTHMPCCDCARAIIQSGIGKVFVDKSSMQPDSAFVSKWSEQIAETQHMFTEAGVALVFVDMQAPGPPDNQT